eukprot:gene13408-13536_t
MSRVHLLGAGSIAIKHRLSHDSVVVLLQNGVLGVYQEAVRNGGLVGNTYAEDIWRQVIREFVEVFAADLDGLFKSDSNGSVTAAASTSFDSQRLEQLAQQLFNQVTHVVDVNSTNFNSMLQSVVKHQQTEIEYINGFVMREGQAKGVPTPWNHMLWTMVKAREAVPVQLLTRELL